MVRKGEKIRILKDRATVSGDTLEAGKIVIVISAVDRIIAIYTEGPRTWMVFFEIEDENVTWERVIDSGPNMKDYVKMMRSSIMEMRA